MEWSTDKRYHTDGHWGRYAQWEKSQKALYCLILLLLDIQNRELYTDRKYISGYLWLEVRLAEMSSDY